MRTTFFFLIALIVCLAGCTSKKSENESVAAPSQPTAQITPGSEAKISGTIKFDGAVPAPQKIDMSQDPSCGSEPAFDESLVVDHGNLANVFVYVKPERKGGYLVAKIEPTPVIEQHGCRYRPHVLGIMIGDSVRIVNADDTTHNIHPMPKESKQWNESQLPKADPIVKSFQQPELMIPIKCNQHPWMKMYLNVASTPWFAVTGPDGKFEIKGLPPGEYTLAAVHEKLGEQDVKVTVGPKDSKTADFTFKAQ